jgi:acetyl esterase/lipase
MRVQAQAVGRAVSYVHTHLRPSDPLAPLMLCGHSSGAHICALYLLNAASAGDDTLTDAFVGLSGVYDIEQHYIWEACRGVHEVSPMKAASLGEHRFPDFSPTTLLQRGEVRSVSADTALQAISSLYARSLTCSRLRSFCTAPTMRQCRTTARGSSHSNSSDTVRTYTRTS